MNTTLMCAILIGIIIVVLGIFIRQYKKRNIAALLENRKALSDEEFYVEFYENSKIPKDLVIQLRNEVAEILEVPASKLRPEDRFGKQLGPYWVTSDELDVLSVKAENRAKSLGITVDLKKVHTLNDYILSFSKMGRI